MEPKKYDFNLDAYRKGPAAAARYERELDSQVIVHIEQRKTESIREQTKEIILKLGIEAESKVNDVMGRFLM